MIFADQRLPILIATKPVDFRFGHNVLALIVQTELKLDPHSGVTVVFRSKRGDRLKILVWGCARPAIPAKPCCARPSRSARSGPQTTRNI